MFSIAMGSMRQRWVQYRPMARLTAGCSCISAQMGLLIAARAAAAAQPAPAALQDMWSAGDRS